jgi:uncharacterized protein
MKWLFRSFALLMLTTALTACQMATIRPFTGSNLQAGLDAYDRGNYKTAQRLLKPLAEQGNPQAQAKLGNMYWLGLGVPESDKSAAKWLTKAANQGDPEAEVALGKLYVLGSGVPQDYAKAAALFRRPAKQGSADAQFFMGMLYSYGNGVPKNLVKAYMWFKRSADQGNTGARDAANLVMQQMTPDQLAEAESMAKGLPAKKTK